ncbi:F390 synthetase-related protein [Brevibacillus sp. SYSU BS000544]|uniref:F390 synthetase-related protein n=1 Tax=Brevibacillus sp. SYSU BS000544 TaxID=3416443 RepID=UPI003CE581C2
MLKRAFLFLYCLWRARHPKKFNSREELERWQHEMIVKHLQIILPKSWYYRSLYTGLPFDEWSRFPIIQKQEMMSNFDDLNTLGIHKEEAFAIALEAERSRNFDPKVNGATIGLSSGTSGNRGLFLVTDEETASWAGYILGKVMPGSLFEHHKVAFFLRANSNLYTTVSKGRIQFCFFDLQKDISENMKQLADFDPTILVAPPSMLRYIATKQERGQLKLHPQKILSVAEVLDPLDEAHIRRTFNQVIHQVYQCTEGFLATTCAYGTLHVNEDLVVIQKDYLDESKSRFSPIITDFSRKAQPIIRYRLNDILVEKKSACPCGSLFTAIEAIEGRCDDLFYLPSSKVRERLIPVFPDFIRRAVIASSSLLEQYIVVQDSPLEMTIYLDAPEQVESLVRASIESMCTELGTAIPTIRFNPYNHVPTDKKLRRVERRFPINDDQVV